MQPKICQFNKDQCCIAVWSSEEQSLTSKAEGDILANKSHWRIFFSNMTIYDCVCVLEKIEKMSFWTQSLTTKAFGSPELQNVIY